MTADARRKRITLDDVAAHANVDRSVVSRVMTNDPRLNVRESTRQRVLDSIEALNYRPNAMARSLRTARAGAFGLLIPDFSNPVYASIIKGAEAAAADRDCLLLTGSAEAQPDGELSDRYLELVGSGRVDGLLLAGGGPISEITQRVGGLRLPWLMLNRATPGATRYVVLDDERAATLAVEHLVDLGHRRIAHLAGPAGADTAQRRESGYRAALTAANLNGQRALVVRGDYTNRGGAIAMEKLLARKQPPTAVFVANVAAAIGAVWAARRAGFVIPDQLSVVAVHDLPLAEYMQPALTTVRMPLEQLGRRGLELIASEPASALITEVLTEPIELISRGSTAPPS